MVAELGELSSRHQPLQPVGESSLFWLGYCNRLRCGPLCVYRLLYFVVCYFRIVTVYVITKMDTLPEQTRELIRKMSDERLKQNLMKAGLPSAAVNALDRQALMSAWAEMIASGQDEPASATAAQSLSDPEFEERK